MGSFAPPTADSFSELEELQAIHGAACTVHGLPLDSAAAQTLQLHAQGMRDRSELVNLARSFP